MELSVLIVEDDFVIQMYLERVISLLGCKIIGISDNSDDALVLAAHFNPDIILMDIGIKGKKDGVETAAIVNKIFQTPVVFITGNSDDLTLKRAEKTNPLHFIFKPIDEEQLEHEFEIIYTKLKLKNSPYPSTESSP